MASAEGAVNGVVKGRDNGLNRIPTAEESSLMMAQVTAPETPWTVLGRSSDSQLPGGQVVPDDPVRRARAGRFSLPPPISG